MNNDALQGDAGNSKPGKRPGAPNGRPDATGNTRAVKKKNWWYVEKDEVHNFGSHTISCFVF